MDKEVTQPEARGLTCRERDGSLVQSLSVKVTKAVSLREEISPSQPQFIQVVVSKVFLCLPEAPCLEKQLDLPTFPSLNPWALRSRWVRFQCPRLAQYFSDNPTNPTSWKTNNPIIFPWGEDKKGNGLVLGTFFEYLQTLSKIRYGPSKARADAMLTELLQGNDKNSLRRCSLGLVFFLLPLQIDFDFRVWYLFFLVFRCGAWPDF